MDFPLYEADIKSYAAFQEAKVFQARKGSIEELEAQINAIKAKKNAELTLNVDATPGEKTKIEAEAARQILELDNQITLKRLENQKYLMEAKLATIKEGSVEELEERQKIAAKSNEIEIKTYGISAEKIKALIAQGAKEQQEFNRQIADKKLQTELDSINEQLSYSLEGSAREFQLKADVLEKQRQLDLNAKDVTDSKKLLIEGEYLKKIRELNKQFNRQTQEEAIQTKQSEINAKLANLQSASTSDNNAQVLNLKKQLIDEQAGLDIIAALNTINNEEQKEAKIKEIRTKANADKRAIEETAFNSTLQKNLDIENAEIELEKKKLELKGGSAKQIRQLELNQIDAEYEANELKIQSEEEYLKKKLELQGKYIDLENKKKQEQQEIFKQLSQAGLDILKQLSDSYFETESAQRQAASEDAFAALENSKQRELDNKNLTEQQRADIEAKYKAKERAIKRKDAEAERDAKIAQAKMNGLLGITAVFAVPDFTFGILSAIRIGLIAATTAIQIQKIKSTPLPAFKTGTTKAPRGYALVGEEGPEIVRLAGGERIYKYADSMKIAEAWKGGSMASADDILSMGGRLPTVDSEIISNSYVSSNGSMRIDYEQLGRAVAKYIPAPVSNNISMDESGFTKHIIEAGNRTTIRNQRYKF